MVAETALLELQTMLVEGGFDDPDADADMAAFEATLSLRPADRYSPGPRFSVEFTRQFMHHDADGEYSGMEQLTARVDYLPHPDFEAITPLKGDWGTAAQFWGTPGPRSDAWIRRVEADPSFIAALRHTPVSVEVTQGPV